jgi:tRNA-specific adenosine deaminase 1
VRFLNNYISFDQSPEILLGGDASMTELEAIQSTESLLAHMEGKKRKATDQEVDCNSLSLYTYKSKRQKLNKKGDSISDEKDVGSTTVRRGRVGYQEFGILRTKPGRVDSEPTLSMSCRYVSQKLDEGIFAELMLYQPII